MTSTASPTLFVSYCNLYQRFAMCQKSVCALCKCVLVCLPVGVLCEFEYASIILSTSLLCPVNRNLSTHARNRTESPYRGRNSEMIFSTLSVKYIHYFPSPHRLRLPLLLPFSLISVFHPSFSAPGDPVHSVCLLTLTPCPPLLSFLSSPLHCGVISLCFSTVHHYHSFSSPLSSITLSHRFASYYCRMDLHLSKIGGT